MKNIGEGKSRKHRLSAALLAGTILATGLYGCSNDDQPNDKTPTPLEKPVTYTPPQEIHPACKATVVIDRDISDETQKVFKKMERKGGVYTQALVHYADQTLKDACENTDDGTPEEDDLDSILSNVDSIVEAYHTNEKLDDVEGLSLYHHLLNHGVRQAVKEVARFTVAAEFAQNGDKSLAKELTRQKAEEWKEFQSLYQQELLAEHTPEQAASAAGSAVLNKLLHSPTFTQTYADDALYNHFVDVYEGKSSQLEPRVYNQAVLEKSATLGAVNFSLHVALPEYQSLATTTPNLAKMVDALEEIYGDKTTSESFYTGGSPYPQLDPDDIYSIMKGTDNIYSMKQVMDRAEGTILYNIDYIARDEDKSTYFNLCAQVDFSDDQVQEDALELWQSLQKLKASGTLFGQAITDFAIKTDIFYCYADIGENEGEWHGSEGVAYNSMDSDAVNAAEQLLTEEHETFHALQHVHGVDKDNLTWSISKNQMATLSMEAAAFVSEYLTAIEFRAAGKSELWRNVQYEPAAKVALATYERGIKAEHLSKREALKRAGLAGWQEKMKDRDFLDIYNSQVFKAYLGNAIFGGLSTPATDTGEVDMDRLRRVGKLTEDFNFTAAVDVLPAKLDVFGRNKQMRQAFDYATLAYMERSEAVDQKTYDDFFEKLKKDKNPYIYIDAEKLHEVLADKADSQVLSVLNKYAKRATTPSARR